MGREMMAGIAAETETDRNLNRAIRRAGTC